MPSFEECGRLCRNGCEFGSRRLKIESSVVVACEGWLLSVGSSEIANVSKAVELCRLWRSWPSETGVEKLGCDSLLRVDLPALPNDNSEVS